MCRKDAEIELEIPTPDGQVPRIVPGYNLLFAGTMNEDESTQSRPTRWWTARTSCHTRRSHPVCAPDISHKPYVSN